MVSLMVILFSTKCFLFVSMNIDLLKLKAYKLFENSDADLSGFFFKEANFFRSTFILISFVFKSLLARVFFTLTAKKRAFDNIGKKEKNLQLALSPFPHCFLLLQGQDHLSYIYSFSPNTCRFG